MTVATTDDEPDRYVFAKLYAKNHVRADRWYKLGRTILYGALEDETPFGTVRRFVEYEDYTLRLMYDEGLPAPKPYGIVEITPEREYMIVMEFFDDAVEIGDAEVSDHVIDEGLELVRRMWDIGLAHRDIKPANLMVQGDELRLIDVFFVQVRPSPWRQAVDLANMMMVLALRSDAPRVYEHALRYFTPRRDRGGLRRHARRGEPDAAPFADEAARRGPAGGVPRARPTPPVDPDPAMERPPRRPDALGAVAGVPRRGPGRLELERVRMSAGSVARRWPPRCCCCRSPGAPRATAARLRCAPTSRTACSSCSPSRCRRRPSSRAYPSSRRAGRSEGTDISSGLGRFWLDSDRGGIHAVEVSLRSSCDTTDAIEERPAPDEAATRVFVRPDSLNPSFTGVRLPALQGWLHRLHVPLRERRVVDARDRGRRSALAAPSRHGRRRRAEESGLTLCGRGRRPVRGSIRRC
jgi:serine/threonine-protein kinase RIO1